MHVYLLAEETNCEKKNDVLRTFTTPLPTGKINNKVNSENRCSIDFHIKVSWIVKLFDVNSRLY